MVTQREPGEPRREQNEAQEGSKVDGNETQEGPKGQRDTKGEQEGDKRTKEGFNSAQEDSKGKQKEAKRAKGGPGRHQRVRRVAKGRQIGEFDYCYTVS